jgi:hypothetical protein
MITYAYWLGVIGLAVAALVVLGGKLDNWKAAAISAVVIFFLGTAAYFFHFQQLFVKRYGGVMKVSVPEGQQHIAVTWKDDNLWIENYDPVTDTCYFTEYSRANILEGRVIIENCNPLARR